MSGKYVFDIAVYRMEEGGGISKIFEYHFPHSGNEKPAVEKYS